MKKLIVQAGVPETFGLGFLGAVIGGLLLEAGAQGAMPAVLIGGAIGACAASAAFVGVRGRGVRASPARSQLG